MIAGRTVAFRRVLVDVAGGVLPALFLSQVMHWQGHYGDGIWWSRSREDWFAEIGMTRRQQETCRKALRDRKLIEERRSGMPFRIECRLTDAVRNLCKFGKGGTSPSVGRNQPIRRAEPALPAGTNQPNHLCENEEENKKQITSYAVPGFMPGQSVVRAPQVRPEPRTPDARPVAPIPQEDPAPPRSGPSLADVVNGLRTTYPHPTNRGAAKRVPSPVSIENWLAEHIRLGRLGPDDYAHILAGAQREADQASTNPDAYRVLLKNWIKDACWGEEIHEDDPCDSLPPKSTGPRFTPKDYFKQDLQTE